MFSFFSKKSKEGKKEQEGIVAVAKARMFPIEEVKDELFSQKIMGDGVAFELEEDQVCAPVDGELTAMFETGHAFGIRCKDGLEVLVHIGIDTVNLKGQGFTVHKKQGEKVAAGDLIVTVNRDLVKKQGYDLSTMLIITNPAGRTITFSEYGEVEKGVRIG